MITNLSPPQGDHVRLSIKKLSKTFRLSKAKGLPNTRSSTYIALGPNRVCTTVAHIKSNLCHSNLGPPHPLDGHIPAIGCITEGCNHTSVDAGSYNDVPGCRSHNAGQDTPSAAVFSVPQFHTIAAAPKKLLEVVPGK